MVEDIGFVYSVKPVFCRYIYGCVSEKGDHMGWPDSETNYKFVVHSREEIPVIS